MGQYKINKQIIKKIVEELSFWGIVGAIVSGVGYGGYVWIESEMQENKREELVSEFFNSAAKVTINETEFSLNGPNTIFVYENGTYFRYDFRNAIAIIDGPGQADQVIPFSDLDNPLTIEDARSAGCIIAEIIDEKSSEYLEQVGDQQDRIQDIIDRSDAFSSQYCGPS